MNLDSADHMSLVAYPASGTSKNGGPCPTLKTQTIVQANKYVKSQNAKEDVDSCGL
jgi:hypothetical protein